MDKISELYELIYFYERLCSGKENLVLFSEGSENKKVYGPYQKSDGRKIVIIKDISGTRTVSFPKYIMEQHLGRQLDPNTETVDHIDFNFKNNSIDNLRLVPRDIHSADDTRRVKMVKLKCSHCGKKFERSPRIVRDKSKKNTGGTFCSRSCSGKYSRSRQLGLIDKLPSPNFVKSKYYRRKNIKATYIDYLILKYSEKL
jgi:hypothetical protein